MTSLTGPMSGEFKKALEEALKMLEKNEKSRRKLKPTRKERILTMTD